MKSTLAIRNTFKLYERLKRERHINTLFLKGKAFSVFPLRFIYIIVPQLAIKESPVLTGFSVPKKKFSSSVNRHRIRRLMVEAWRLNKHILYTTVPGNNQLHLFVVFTDKVMPDITTVTVAMQKGINKLTTIVASKNE